jgi:hypothetical protein
MFSEDFDQLGERLAAIALASVACAICACGEQIVVGTQPGEPPSEALLISPDAGTEGTPLLAPAAEEPDSDGDDDDSQDDGEPSDGDDDDATERDPSD